MGPYTTVQVTAVEDYKLKDKRGHLPKSHFTQGRSSGITGSYLQKLMKMKMLYPFHISVQC